MEAHRTIQHAPGHVTLHAPERILRVDHKVIGPAVKLAYVWLWNLARLREGMVELTAVELGARFGTGHAAARKWLDKLSALKLIEEHPQRQPGVFRLWVFDEANCLAVASTPEPAPLLDGLEDENTAAHLSLAKGESAEDGAVETHLSCTKGESESPVLRYPAGEKEDPRSAQYTTSLRSLLGAQRFDQLFETIRLEWGENHLECVAPDEFRADLVRRRLGRDIYTLLGQVAPGFTHSIRVDSTPPPSPGPAHLWSTKGERGGTQLSKELSFQSCTQLWKLSNEENPPKLLRKGEQIFEVAKDRACFPWVALMAAWSIEQGVPATEVFRLAELHAGTEIFHTLLPGLFERHKLTWPKMGEVKMRLASFGVAWSSAYSVAVKDRDRPRRAK